MADSHNGVVRAIGPDGVIRTAQSGMSAPVDIAAVAGGGYLIADAAGSVYRVRPDGGRDVVLVPQRGLTLTAFVTADAGGRVYVGDFEAGIVLRSEPGRGVIRVVG